MASSLCHLQVAPCSNVRGAGSLLAAHVDSSCLASGLFHAAVAMQSASKVAGASLALGTTIVDTTTLSCLRALCDVGARQAMCVGHSEAL